MGPEGQKSCPMARPEGAPAGLRSQWFCCPIRGRPGEMIGQITRNVTSQERKLAGGRFPERGKPVSW